MSAESLTDLPEFDQEKWTWHGLPSSFMPQDHVSAEGRKLEKTLHRGCISCFFLLWLNFIFTYSLRRIEFMMAGAMATGERSKGNRKLRDHNFNHIQKAERSNWNLDKIINSPRLCQCILPPTKLHSRKVLPSPTQHHQLGSNSHLEPPQIGWIKEEVTSQGFLKTNQRIIWQRLTGKGATFKTTRRLERI